MDHTTAGDTLEAPGIYVALTGRLAAARKQEHGAAILRGAMISGSLFIAALLCVLIIEDVFYLEVLPRTILFWSLTILAGGLLVWFVLRPLLRLLNILPNESNERTAAKVGARFPRIKDHLVNILQLFHEREKGELYSVELIDASFEDVRKEIEPVNFALIVDNSASWRVGKALLITVATGVLLFVIFPVGFMGSAYRLFNFSRSFAEPPPFRFIVDPGDRDVVKGATVPVRVTVEGQPQHQITIASKPTGQIAYEEQQVQVASDGSFKHEFSAVKLTTTYLIRSGKVESNQFTLTVIDRPVVRMLRVQLVFPSYANLAPRQLDDNVGDVSALKGTKILLSVETNKELGEAGLIFSSGERVSLNTTSARATGSFTLFKDLSYHIVLRDNDGILNADPIEYALRVVPDAFPTASIAIPGANLDITENAQLNMLLKITDDYGFSSFRLAYRLVQSRYEKPAEDYAFVSVPLPMGVRTGADVAFLWSLSQLNLVPEDVVSYYIEVFDNDRISGPKSGRSAIYTLRLPSLEEVFADVDKGHETSLETMKEALQQAQEAKKELEELQQDIKKNQQKMDWQEQKKAEELSKKYGEIQKKLDDVNKTVEQMVQEMQKNKVLSKETMDKYTELQQLMEQMNSPEFAESMKKMQQAMQQMSPEAMKQALQQFKFSEENFRKNIERTLNLLKRIQIEQKVDEALKRAEEIMKQQEDLLKQTDAGDRDKLKGLAQQQEDLKDQLEQLKKELAELQKKMEEFPAEMPLSEMEKARDELNQSKPDEQMEQAAEQMQQQSSDGKQQAMQNQKQVMQKMGQVMSKMQQMQKAMQQNQQRQIVNEMRKAIQDLLELSRRQESLKNESRSMDQNSQRFRENSRDQMDLMRELANVANGMSKLSQKTFGITPEMGKSIGDALRQMDQSMQSLDQRNGSSAGEQQSGAMGSLNQAAQQVQNAMNAMMQGAGQGMGMAGFMQRLQQMSGMQQGINQGTQNLGGMSPQQAGEMARLAGEQGMVRKSLEQLAKEAAGSGDLSKMLGDLNRAAQEMREVQTDLAQGNVNPETLKKQDRILSRLLDSQRSARERDFEKRRKAESGTNVARRSPGDFDPATLEGRNRLRQDLLKALEEGYSKDYEELIRKYFDALEKSEIQN